MKTQLIPWMELTKLSRGEEIEVERVRIKRTGIAIEGRFELPPLVQITDEDQVFISAFLRSHGSIKEMERLFGISYPTVKARLTRVAKQLPFIESVEALDSSTPSPKEGARKEILDRLANGEINASDAAKLLRKKEES